MLKYVMYTYCSDLEIKLVSIELVGKLVGVTALLQSKQVFYNNS